MSGDFLNIEGIVRCSSEHRRDRQGFSDALLNIEEVDRCSLVLDSNSVGVGGVKISNCTDFFNGSNTFEVAGGSEF